MCRWWWRFVKYGISKLKIIAKASEIKDARYFRRRFERRSLDSRSRRHSRARTTGNNGATWRTWGDVNIALFAKVHMWVSFSAGFSRLSTANSHRARIRAFPDAAVENFSRDARFEFAPDDNVAALRFSRLFTLSPHLTHPRKSREFSSGDVFPAEFSAVLPAVRNAPFSAFFSGGKRVRGKTGLCCVRRILFCNFCTFRWWDNDYCIIGWLQRVDSDGRERRFFVPHFFGVDVETTFFGSNVGKMKVDWKREENGNCSNSEWNYCGSSMYENEEFWVFGIRKMCVFWEKIGFRMLFL